MAGTSIRVVGEKLSDGSGVFNLVVTFPHGGGRVVFNLDSEKSAIDLEYALAKIFNDFEDIGKIIYVGAQREV
jgi:hypothetical protein